MLPLLLLASPVLTTAELAEHDKPGDCWTLIDGKVYDLSEWVPKHPGGEEILRACGKDASRFYAARPDGSPHSAGADEVLASTYIGDLGQEMQAKGELPHPHDQRAEGTRLALLPTAAVGPKGSIAFRAGHSLSFGDSPSGIGIGIGYSFGRIDLLLSDYRAQGLGGLEFKFQALDQQRGAPLSVSIGAGGGFASVADAPALQSQLILERQDLDRRLSTRLVATGGMSPGVQDSNKLSAGASLEFRPMPIHSVFAEAIVPISAPEQVAFSAGARIFTSGHVFSLYYSSTPNLAPWALAAPALQEHAVGLALERALRL